jgi:hypothetical protein
LTPTDSREAAVEYWSRKVFGVDSHAAVRYAVMTGRASACERAWGRLEDKRAAAGRDGSTPLRDPQGFYAWALREELS